MALQCVLSGLLLALPVAFSESTHAQDATPSVRIESDRATPHATSGEVVRVVGSRINLEITERFSKVLEFPSRIAAVDGHDEDVLTVHPLSPSKIRLQSVSQGVTQAVFTDENGAVTTVTVLVSGDARFVQAVLREKFPEASITATRVRDAIVLRGTVSEPSVIPEIQEIAETHGRVLNQIRVAGPQHVQLNCKIFEVQRSRLRQLGFDFLFRTPSFVGGSAPSGVNPISGLSIIPGAAPAGALAATGLPQSQMALGIVSDTFSFQGVLQALREEGLLKIQSEPTILTRSGQPGRIVSGGEFPIPVPQGLGTIAIEYREFGTRLECAPIILSPRRLKQQIVAEVSERDQTTAVTIGSVQVPGISRRLVENEVEMNFGETLVVGGLVLNRSTASTRKIPFLGELPGIGALFRRVQYTDAETELMVVITPELVAPAGMPDRLPGTSTSIPTDRELFYQGVIEVPNYGGWCDGANCEQQFGSYGGSGACPTPAGYEAAAPGMAPPVAAPVASPVPQLYDSGPVPPPPAGSSPPAAGSTVTPGLILPPAPGEPTTKSSRGTSGRSDRVQVSQKPAPRPKAATKSPEPRNEANDDSESAEAIVPASGREEKSAKSPVEPAGGSKAIKLFR